MNFHIHTGPGNHDKILLSELRRHKVPHSYTKNHPLFQFGITEDFKSYHLERSKVYDSMAWLIWGIRNRIPKYRKSKYHLDILYPIYDTITSSYLKNYKNLFCWPQVSLSCIRTIKKNNGKAILEYPIPHITTWMNILKEESKKFGLPLSETTFSDRMHKRMIMEIEESDFVSIPSIFVKKSFVENGVPERKLIINNYGIDDTFFSPAPSKDLDKPFKIIFVGTVEIRKGVIYLLEAFDKIRSSNCELRIIGKIHPHFHEFIEKYKNNGKIKFLGLLPKEKTVMEMQQADVMVMPSILEGLSMTIPETMSTGTPVISSENAGGLDIIDEGRNGFVVPNKSVEALYEKIKWCINNRDKLVAMGINARSKVLTGFTQKAYGERMISNLQKLHVI